MIVSSPSVVYITEIARKDVRGAFLILGPSFAALGKFICFYSLLTIIKNNGVKLNLAITQKFKKIYLQLFARPTFL